MTGSVNSRNFNIPHFGVHATPKHTSTPNPFRAFAEFFSNQTSSAKTFSAKLSSQAFEVEKRWTMRVMQEIKPYFFSPYKHRSHWKKAEKWINGSLYTVERFNHGLAHGLRQEALAKDIVELLAHKTFNHPELDGFFDWIQSKRTDSNFMKKIEMASAFQRSGRQSEVTSSSHPKLYSAYEWQDSLNFRQAAERSRLFASPLEIKIFEEAILWSNPGSLDENQFPDLKYGRRLLHAAHLLDLRRIPSFNKEKIRDETLEKLFGNVQVLGYGHQIFECLWKRSGEYLRATGDRDLVDNRALQDKFFLQTKHPSSMVEAISRVRRISIKKTWN